MVLLLSWEWGSSPCRMWIWVLGEGETDGVWASSCPTDAPTLGTVKMGYSAFMLFPLEQNLPAMSCCYSSIEGQKAQMLIFMFNAFQ